MALSHQKHKTKKYFNLLKNAQNVAFVGLVTQNLAQEIGAVHGQIARPDKILKVVQFLNHNVLKCTDSVIKNREFARLKITEALIPLVASKLDGPHHS